MAMHTVTDSLEFLGSALPPNRGHHGSSHVGKSSKGTTAGCYILHTVCVGLIKSLAHPYLVVS